MQELIDSLMKSKGQELIGQLTQKLGFSNAQGEGLLGGLLEQLGGLFTGGKAEPSQLLGGDLSGLMGNLDFNALASKAGVSAEQAEAGVKEVGPNLMSEVQGMMDGPDDLLKMVTGGDAGGLLGKVGGLFGKK
ncbi:MAG: hypothetical protein AAF432_15495 [Planctomycetota bacterium]